MLIQHADRMRQLIDFTNLQFGDKIHPTDLDGVIEFRDEKYIFYEYKYKSKELPLGQKLALERLVDDAAKAGKKAIALVCEHAVEDPLEPVDAGEAFVRAAYYDKEWHKATCLCTVRRYTSLFLWGKNYE